MSTNSCAADKLEEAISHEDFKRLVLAAGKIRRERRDSLAGMLFNFVNDILKDVGASSIFSLDTITDALGRRHQPPGL
jgi:hypothetical protein